MPRPWLVVGAAVLFNYWWLRAEVLPVAYLNDSSVHEQMVRFATARIQAGHLPQTSWFPYLGLGSPQFLHYQSLGATLTGLLGTVTGPDHAFTLSLYLLVSLWPVSVYAGARAFQLNQWSAAVAAVLSAFVASKIGIGFETQAYLWTGFGVWAQLWAMLTLPLAWGYSWQAIATGRRFGPAVLFVSLTVAFHYETGYLALIPLALLPFLAPSDLRRRIGRAAVVAAGSLAATAWVIVPVVAQSRWASVNEILRGTPLENGYGARQVLDWLVTGQLLDAGRLPVLTLLAGAGLVVCLVRFTRDERLRALVLLLAMSLLLSFGRTTFGSLVRIIPGSTDIFMRRFMMGVQLALLDMAGVGTVALASVAWGAARRRWPRLPAAVAAPPWRRWAAAGAVVVLAVVALSPAWTQSVSHDRRNAAAIAAQRRADVVQGRQIAPLLARIAADGGGRAYAGMPDDWGADFTVGAVPVFKYLESKDIDEVGYTLRTASLMTDPEYFFDQADPGDYVLFGIRWLVLPTGDVPPVRAVPVMVRGPYALWELPSVGYVHLAHTVGTFTADRANVGVRSVPYLRSALPTDGETLTVHWATGPPTPLPAHVAPGASPPGRVLAQRAALASGTASAVVDLGAAATVVLSASYDPGWHVTVDGRAARALEVAPALVAVDVGPGRHRVVFTYRGFGWYPELAVVGALDLGAAWVIDRRRQRRLVPAPGGAAGPRGGRPAPGPGSGSGAAGA